MNIMKQNSHYINSDLEEVFGDGLFPCMNCTMETPHPSFVLFSCL